MVRNSNTSRETLHHVTRTTLSVLPLLRKKFLRMDRIQAEHGMPLSHIQVLAMLDSEPLMSVTGISQRLGVAKPNITPLIDKLIEAGYVERHRNELDRRIVNVLLLPKGRDKLDCIYGAVVDNVAERMDGDLQGCDVQALGRALRTIESILNGEEFTIEM